MVNIEIGSSGRVLRFMTKDGLWLDGVLFSKSANHKTCVIYLHGLGGCYVSNISLALASGLDENLSLFSFNNRGHDEVCVTSRHYAKKKRRITVGSYFEKFEDCIYDIQGAIDALSKLGYRKFILCGHSTGCQKAAYYQYKTNDKRIHAIVLLAPADDYNLDKKEFGTRYKQLVKKCTELIRKGKGNVVPQYSHGHCAQRLDSLLNLGRIEARLFNYNGDLREFGLIKTPILAVFGSDEEYRLMPVSKYLAMLKNKSRSRRFTSMEIAGANHSFENKEAELVKKISKWLCK